MAQLDILGQFSQAQRYKRKARIAIYGPSGGGKTRTALEFASFIAGVEGKDIAFIDTEKDSATLYAPASPGEPLRVGEFNFKHLSTSAPFDHSWLTQAIKQIAASGQFSVLVIDSLSHWWFGEGGLLDQKEALAKTPKFDSFSAWSEISKRYNSLVETIIDANIHMIITMRSKQEYERKEDSNGRKTIERIGLAPVFRDDIIYEVDLALLMNLGAMCQVDKTRYTEYQGKVAEKPGQSFIKPFYEWLAGSADDPYTYGNGDKVPLNPTSRRVFNEYLAAHNGEKPQDADSLKAWHTGRNQKEEAKAMEQSHG